MYTTKITWMALEEWLAAILDNGQLFLRKGAGDVMILLLFSVFLIDHLYYFISISV